MAAAAASACSTVVIHASGRWANRNPESIPAGLYPPQEKAGRGDPLGPGTRLRRPEEVYPHEALYPWVTSG